MPFNEASIVSHERTSRFQGCFGNFKQIRRLGIIQVVQHTIGKDKVKAGILLNQLLVHCRDVKAATTSKAFPGGFDIFGTQIKTVVFDLRQRFKNVRRTAANVENTIPCPGPDIILNVKPPKTPCADYLRKETVDARVRKNVSNHGEPGCQATLAALPLCGGCASETGNDGLRRRSGVRIAPPNKSLAESYRPS